MNECGLGPVGRGRGTRGRVESKVIASLHSTDGKVRRWTSGRDTLSIRGEFTSCLSRGY